MVRAAVTSGAAKRREACGGDGLPELETGGEDVDHWLQHPLNRCIARGGGGGAKWLVGVTLVHGGACMTDEVCCGYGERGWWLAN
jgi:hypothetical protein